MKPMHHFIKSLAFMVLFVSAISAQASVLTLAPLDPLTSPSGNSGGFVGNFPLVVGDDYILSKTFKEIEEVTLNTTFDGNAAPTLVTFQEVIFNDSGQDWTDFHIQLFPDTETTIAGLTLNSNLGDAFTNFGSIFIGTTGFNEIVYPFADFEVSTDGLELTLFDGLVAAGDVFSLSYSFLISGQDNDQAFSMSQIPSIPEPTSLALLGLGLLGLGVSRRRKTH